MVNILLIQGPNLNLLGRSEKHIYGDVGLANLHENLTKYADKKGSKLFCLQSNSEEKIIHHIHGTLDNNTDGLIINPGGLTHTSVILRDALAKITIPIIEMHISNIYAREDFRCQSYVSGVATGVICGLGIQGYYLAIESIQQILNN